MDTPQLIVHIGAPKTGTTLLQQSATSGRNRLFAAGILYPESILRGYGHHDLAFMLDGAFPEWATPAAVTLGSLAEALTREADKHTGSILISSENFFLFPQPERLAELLHDTGLSAGRKIRILAYVRRQDDLLESWYNQAVKAQGYVGPIASMLVDMPAFLDFERVLSRWTHVFTQEAMAVRLYEEAAKTGLERDFWDALQPGLSTAMPTSARPSNTRISRDILEVQRIINGLDLTPAERRGLHHEFMAMTQKDGPTCPLLTDADRRHVMAHFRTGNNQIARGWFGRDVLYAEETPGSGMREDRYPGLSVERAVELLARAVLARTSRPAPTDESG